MAGKWQDRVWRYMSEHPRLTLFLGMLEGIGIWVLMGFELPRWLAHIFVILPIAFNFYVGYRRR